jgi:hypothetical protein
MQTANPESMAEDDRSIMTDWKALVTPLTAGLGALLLVQLLAALILGLVGKGMEPARSQGPLLAFDAEQVTSVRIQGPDGEPAQVLKTEAGWIIPSLGGLPAAEQKLSGLLSKLGELEKGLPVATSDEALKRFKVAEDTFERKLTLESGDTRLATLFLGDSPGFRRLFVRADADSAVYEAQLGLFDIPDKADDWSDRTLLHLEPEEIERISLSGLILERTEDGWRLADLAEGEEMDQEAVEQLVLDLANLDFLGVQGAEDAPTGARDSTTTEIEATLKSGEAVRFGVLKLPEGEDYLLEVSNRPQRFRLASYAAKDLIGVSRTDLLVTPEQEEPTKEAEPSDGAVEFGGIEAPAPTATQDPVAATPIDVESRRTGAASPAPQPKAPEVGPADAPVQQGTPETSR